MNEKSALIIVDVQNDFCLGGALAVPGGDEVVTILNPMKAHVLRKGGMVFASRDWHPAVTGHFKPYGGQWPVHCVKNTRGAEFHPKLNIAQTLIVSKGTKPNEDGFSAFAGETKSGFMLSAVLHDFGIKKVYVGGLATDYCVKATALDAMEREFRTFLLRDACRAVNVNPGDEERAIEEMRNAGVIITTTDEVINANREQSR